MTTAQALEQARAICNGCYRGYAPQLPNLIAAALMRAYADGMDSMLTSPFADHDGKRLERDRIRAEADKLERVRTRPETQG